MVISSTEGMSKYRIILAADPIIGASGYFFHLNFRFRLEGGVRLGSCLCTKCHIIEDL